MRFILLLLFNSLVNLHLLFAQEFKTLRGTIIDESGTALPGASIVIHSQNKSLVSDEQGRFSFSVARDSLTWIEVYYIGYKRYNDTLNLKEETEITILLEHENLTLQEIVITDNTAERIRKEEVLNIEIVNNEYLKQNLGGSLMKSIERLPGVSTIDIGSGLSKPVIRGLAFNRVLVVENGIRHEAQQWGAEHGLEIDQFAVENIEVVKGPSSIIYGSDAIGGVINIKPAALPENNVVKINTEFVGKSNNDYLGSSISLALKRGIMFFSFRSTRSAYGDYKVPTDSVEIYSYRAPLNKHHLRNTAGKEQNYHLTIGVIKPKWQSRIITSSVQNENGFFANAHGLEPRNVDTDLHDRSDRDIQYPFHHVNHFKLINETIVFINGFELSSNLGFQQNKRQEWSQYVSHGYMPAVFPESQSFDANLEKEFLKNTISANAILSTSLKENTKVMLGLSSDFQNNEIDGRSFLIPSFKQFASGMFLHLSNQINEENRFQMGVRYDYGYIETESYKDWFISPIITLSDTIYTLVERSKSIYRKFSNISYSIGYNYHPQYWIIKANLGKSFRMPIAKELSANGVNYHHYSYEVGSANLSSEVSYQLDLGIEFVTRDLAIGISPFFNYFTNYIFLNPSAEHDRLYGNGNQIYYYIQSDVMRYGGEIHAHYLIIKPIQIGVIGEYLYIEQTSGAKKGFSLPFTPPPNAILNFKYRIRETKAIKKAYFSFDYQMGAKQNRIVPPEEPTKAYQTVNIAIGGTLKLWKQDLHLFIQGNNILNRLYFNHTSYYRLINVPEAGRNFVLTISVPLSIKLNKT